MPSYFSYKGMVSVSEILIYSITASKITFCFYTGSETVTRRSGRVLLSIKGKEIWVGILQRVQTPRVSNYLLLTSHSPNFLTVFVG